MATLCSQCQVRKGLYRYRTTLLDGPLFQRVELQQQQASKQVARRASGVAVAAIRLPLAGAQTMTHLQGQEKNRLNERKTQKGKTDEREPHVTIFGGRKQEKVGHSRNRGAKHSSCPKSEGTQVFLKPSPVDPKKRTSRRMTIQNTQVLLRSPHTRTRCQRTSNAAVLSPRAVARWLSPLGGNQKAATTMQSSYF